MKYTLLLFLAATMVAGCASSAVEPMGDASYYPLAVGNWWAYSGVTHPRDTATYRVTGESTINGRMYAIVESTYGLDGGSSIVSFYRADASGRVYRVEDLTAAPPSETLVVDPSLAEGESVGTTVLVRKNLSDTVRAGVFQQCHEFHEVDMETSGTTYAPGIGPIRRFWFRGVHELAQAFVNGVHYP
jgi:hypothetical protein